MLSCEQVWINNQSDNGYLIGCWSKPAHNQSDNGIVLSQVWINEPIRYLIGSLIQTCSQLNINGIMLSCEQVWINKPIR